MIAHSLIWEAQLRSLSDVENKKDLLLRQGALSVNLTKKKDSLRATIDGLTGEALAYVYPQGHPDVSYQPKEESTYSPDERQKGIREKNHLFQ